MTREELANIKNRKTTIGRELVLSYKLDLEEGQIYDNRGKVESWAGDNSDEMLVNAGGNGYTYYFRCDDEVECHAVDYDNEEEVEFLEATEGEDEVLISADTKFEIVSVSTDSDYEEMGYYEVELKEVK